MHPERFNNPITGAKNRCSQFFEAMLQYSKSTKVFSDITISDLNNKAVAKRMYSNRVGDLIGDYVGTHNIDATKLK